MPSSRKRRKKRHTPTRIPYSCQDQFGTSGIKLCPVGAGSTWQGMGRAMSQTSRLTMVQNTRRAPLGRRRGGRSTIAENGARSRGSNASVMATLIFSRAKKPYRWFRVTAQLSTAPSADIWISVPRGSEIFTNLFLNRHCQKCTQSYISFSYMKFRATKANWGWVHE